MMEVRCCCKPENLIGYLPDPIAIDSEVFLRVGDYDCDKPYPGHVLLRIRELNDGSSAYSSEGHNEETIRALPGFLPAEAGKGTKKTWRKTWKEK